MQMLLIKQLFSLIFDYSPETSEASVNRVQENAHYRRRPVG
jgi:hypothetical protein